MLLRNMLVCSCFKQTNKQKSCIFTEFSLYQNSWLLDQILTKINKKCVINCHKFNVMSNSNTLNAYIVKSGSTVITVVNSYK